jgi:hypothetical protein
LRQVLRDEAPLLRRLEAMAAKLYARKLRYGGAL